MVPSNVTLYLKKKCFFSQLHPSIGHLAPFQLYLKKDNKRLCGLNDKSSKNWLSAGNLALNWLPSGQLSCSGI